MTAVAAAAHEDHHDDGESEAERRIKAQLEERERQERIAEEKAAAEKRELERKRLEAERLARIKAEKEAWLKMSPSEREAVTIKKMWIAPCKSWLCLNK